MTSGVNGPSGSGYYIALTTPTPGVVRVSSHGLIRNRALDYADYNAALTVARKWARESGFWIYDYAKPKQNGEPQIHKRGAAAGQPTP